jgi:hypothetical protein
MDTLLVTYSVRYHHAGQAMGTGWRQSEVAIDNAHRVIVAIGIIRPAHYINNERAHDIPQTLCIE